MIPVRSVVQLCGLAIMGPATLAVAQSPASIEGVWRIEEITMTGANAATRKVVQPNLYIFTKRHYSVIRVLGDSARKRLADDRKATAQELLEVYVDAFIANAGTYELDQGLLTTHPTIAKDPGTMAPGVYVRFKVGRDRNTLTLTDESSSWGGVATNPQTIRLVRVE